MQLALAVKGGFRHTEGSFAIAVEPEVARLLAGIPSANLLILPAAGEVGDVGAARLLSVELDGAGRGTARLATDRRLGSFASLAGYLAGPFPLQLISDEDYAAILAAAEPRAFVQPDATPAGEMTEFAAGFRHFADLGDLPISAVLETLRRETGNLCALTGGLLIPNAMPTAIRWEGAARLHVNNLLLLSPPAEEAFRKGHFTARNDLSIIVDFSRIDPELLETINPNGRLGVPDTPGLQPSPENLAWHRRHIFRLA